MKKFLALACLAAFAATPLLAEFKQVRTEAEYIEKFVGKTLVDPDGNTFRVTADGKLTGKLTNGDKVRGAWKWNRRFWCRNVIVGGRELGTDCQKIEVDGNQYRLTRKKGRGEVRVGTLQ